LTEEHADPVFHTADYEAVRQGKTTDVYFERTMQIMRAKGIDKRVKAEFIAKSLPSNWPWAVLKDMPLRVRAFPEGSIFRPFQPVMEVEGMYGDFAVYETAILGLICQATGIATRAARCKKLAEDRLVISFGARRMHPILAPMIERNAYVGGCDGVSVIGSAALLGEDPMGTMPHALILIFGSTVEATKAFDEVMSPGVKRVSLIDTFNDEKFEALNVAEALGERLYAVRLDTPRSRRGNFHHLLQEVRWELDIRGHQHVKLFVSGGIGEADIVELNDLVDAYGIGTFISNSPVVDFAMDIIEVEGKPFAKRGKWSGSKSVWRCPECLADTITPLAVNPGPCPCGGQYEETLLPFLEQGNLVHPLPRPQEIRHHVLAQVAKLP